MTNEQIVKEVLKIIKKNKNILKSYTVKEIIFCFNEPFDMEAEEVDEIEDLIEYQLH